MLISKIRKLRAITPNRKIGYKTPVKVPNFFPSIYERVLSKTLENLENADISKPTTEWCLLLKDEYVNPTEETTTIYLYGNDIKFETLILESIKEILSCTKDPKEIFIGLDILTNIAELNRIA